jgi:hypothetical protein
MKNIVVCSLKARTVETQQPAVSRQRPVSNREIVSCAVRADEYECNNGIHRAFAKQQFHCNSGTVFATRSMTKCYKQDKLGTRVSEKTRPKAKNDCAGEGQQQFHRPTGILKYSFESCESRNCE